MPGKTLPDIIYFAEFLLAFQSVKRQIILKGRAEKENDSEHSYMLAMMALYLNDIRDLQLNAGRLQMYALCHDLVETYAGDTMLYDTAARQTKYEREDAALKRIEQEFPGAASIIEAIHEYREKDNAEAQFIYALDKLMPALMVYMQGGESWREHGIGLENIQRTKRPLVKDVPLVAGLFEELFIELEKRPDLFRETS